MNTATKTMTLKKALSFARTNRLETFGFTVNYMAEQPNDKNNEPAFGYFPVAIPEGKRKFWCDVDGKFEVVDAKSVIVRIYNKSEDCGGIVI